MCYPQVCGLVGVGDEVMVNVDALLMGLGTGGKGFIAANLSRLPTDRSDPGHLVKARYTPTQVTVMGTDEQDSPHHETLRAADSLEGMPVVCADLHSALPAIVAGIRLAAPSARVTYVLSDGGALPAAFSRTAAQLVQLGWLTDVVSVGQAYGGTLEAVNVHSGLLAARHVAGADIAVVAQGPGNLGTGTRWGFSGTASGEALNAAATLHGRPVAALRMSASDPRPRHVGISHHSLTVLERVALVDCDVALPDVDLPAELGATVTKQVARLERHRIATVAADPVTSALRMAGEAGLRLTTMGRSVDVDPLPFQAAAAAGVHAAQFVGSGPMELGGDSKLSGP